MSGTVSRCSRCPRDAVVNVIGTFLNGRPAIDPRCDRHEPTPSDIGCVLLLDDGTRYEPLRYTAVEIRALPALSGKRR